MKEGYYISAFVCVNELQNIMDIKLRHDQTIALWKYENNRIELVRYWELERISGIKMHPKAFYNKVAFFELLEDLLKEEGLKVSDIVSIWGTPEIESNTQYRDWIDKRFAFHSIAHLLTAICFDNDYPFDSTIFAMALDAGPDSKFEPDAYEKLYYSACIIKDSNISFFPVVKLRNRREKKDCQNTSFELRRKEYFEPPHGIDIDKIKKEKNPHELNIEYLTYYFDNPNVFYNRSLLTLDDVSFIKEKAEIFIKKNKYALKR